VAATPRITARLPRASVAAPGRQSLSTVAYEELRSRLRKGLVGPQDRLVDLEIAAQLGVSRMPVREALLQLVSEGYLVSTARGYRIPSLSRQDVLEVFELRRLLEPRAAAHAARDLTRGGIARLGAALSEARAAASAGDFSRLFQANIDFRETWIGAVRNQRLAATISRFADQVLTVRHHTLRDPATQPVVVEHMERLHDAFSAHDPVGAHDSMMQFVMSAERSFHAMFGADDSLQPRSRSPRSLTPEMRQAS